MPVVFVRRVVEVDDGRPVVYLAARNTAIEKRHAPAALERIVRPPHRRYNAFGPAMQFGVGLGPRALHPRDQKPPPPRRSRANSATTAPPVQCLWSSHAVRRWAWPTLRAKSRKGCPAELRSR